MLGIKSLIGLLGFSMLASEITVGASPTYVLNLSTLTKSKRDLLLSRGAPIESRPSLVARAPKGGKGGPKSFIAEAGGAPGGVGGLEGLGGPGGLGAKEAKLGGLEGFGGVRPPPEAFGGPVGKGLLGDILGVAPGADGLPPPPPAELFGGAGALGSPPGKEGKGGKGKGLLGDILGVGPPPPGLAGVPPPPLLLEGEAGKSIGGDGKLVREISSGQGVRGREIRAGGRQFVSGRTGTRELATEAPPPTLPPFVQGEFPPPPTPEFGFGKAGKGGKELGGGGKIVREAALTLAQASRLMDNIMLQMQDTNTSPDDVKRGAELASKLGSGESFLRQVLASISQDPTATQKSLGIIRENAPLVIQGFEEIAKNSGDKGRVKETLEKMGAARKQVLLANNEMIQGLSRGTQSLQRVQSTQSRDGQTQLNTLAINDEGRKTIEEAQRNLAAQSKEVDDQIAILGKEGTGAAEIAAAATKAIEQELAQNFPREVLVSGASNAAAAMQALANVRDREFPQVVAGLRFIAASGNNTQAVKTVVPFVVEGRRLIAEANQRLLELSEGAAAEIKQNNRVANDNGNQARNQASEDAAKKRKELAEQKEEEEAQARLEREVAAEENNLPQVGRQGGVQNAEAELEA
ncbi:hypothetical protein PCASD_08640 [Puccinia coronata f. sp. avenae]|uniref:Uncharacterized protein n=1 Tax=Puccinia coronata f. sp. avenae TaxID=200324 RepID=A0A2N5V7B7_9BASI|nr:hypothetical protein PCASD_08640 [Puccinia coronata f. sp. avenae]